MADILRAIDRDVLTTPRPALSPLVNWSGGDKLPIHRWFRYREGFSPKLISELALGDRLLDPFCGSGSIMVGAAQQRRESVGIDVNPLAAFVARVKLRPLSASDVSASHDFLNSFEKELSGISSWPIPSLRIAEKVFEPHILQTVLKLRALIDKHSTSHEMRDFLLLSWISILQEVGSYFKEGNGIKYRNKKRLDTGYIARQEGQWQLERFGANQPEFVRSAFRDKLGQMLSDVPAWHAGDWESQSVIEGNSLEEASRLEPASFDSIIFSPPYANRFDYLESQKVELWFGGFVKTYDDMLLLRKRSVRSHLGAALNAEAAPLAEIENLIALINPASYAIRMRVPALIRGYFNDMTSILTSCHRLLKSGGKCFVVVGNSAYGGVIIPTDSLIARLGLAAGFDHASVMPVRHLTVAPQQRSELTGRENFMRESVVILS